MFIDTGLLNRGVVALERMANALERLADDADQFTPTKEEDE